LAVVNKIATLCVTVLCLLAGCARFAVRPPTPAKDLEVEITDPPPGEHFYITVFASQSTPKIARFCHSWATVVHTKEGQETEHLTISWLPVSLAVRPLYFHVRPGRNLELRETMEYVLSNKEQVSQWGPYECRPHLYLRAKVQKDFLDSGVIGYQCTDDIGESARLGNGCDCIHALTDADPSFRREKYPLTRFGNSASRFIVMQLRDRDALLDTRDHLEVNELLGIACYPIKHQPLPTRRVRHSRKDH
jgi:hypothetical protein